MDTFQHRRSLAAPSNASIDYGVSPTWLKKLDKYDFKAKLIVCGYFRSTQNILFPNDIRTIPWIIIHSTILYFDFNIYDLNIKTNIAAQIWLSSYCDDDKHIASFIYLYSNLISIFYKITGINTKYPSREQIKPFFLNKGGYNVPPLQIHCYKFDIFITWFVSICYIIKDLKLYYLEPNNPLKCLFYDRYKTEWNLSSMSKGTFILRLSSNINCLVISYVNKQQLIKHICLTRLSSNNDEHGLYQIGKTNKKIELIDGFIKPWTELIYLFVNEPGNGWKNKPKQFVFGNTHKTIISIYDRDKPIMRMLNYSNSIEHDTSITSFHCILCNKQHRNKEKFEWSVCKHLYGSKCAENMVIMSIFERNIPQCINCRRNLDITEAQTLLPFDEMQVFCQIYRVKKKESNDKDNQPEWLKKLDKYDDRTKTIVVGYFRLSQNKLFPTDNSFYIIPWMIINLSILYYNLNRDDIADIKDKNAAEIWLHSYQEEDQHIANLQALYPHLITKFKYWTKCEQRQPTLQQIELFFVRTGGVYDNNKLLPYIRCNKFDKFYLWFKSMCNIIKDLKSIYERSEDPLIGLFYGRTTATETLEHKPMGTFILRLASSNNVLAITYKNPSDRIQHIALTRISSERYKVGKSDKETLLFNLIRPWPKLKYLYTPNKLIRKKFVF